MIGQTVSHYKILEKIGGGGMGVVYKAHDLKLDRTVALKFLPHDLISDPDAKSRFIHEAKAASGLQHNNICTVHDIDEAADGQVFIVMDCYEGETLKKRIERGPLKIDEAISIGVQIAQGLAQAHKNGIVHRDIKPANIMVTADGTVKVVDFGLAKLSGATKLTKTGSTLGTIAYMCPEQLRGNEVDLRGDIFSFGVLLYEMLTAHLPFRGDHEAALMYSITNESPTPLQGYILDVGPELVRVVNRALEKDPHERYQGMAEVLTDLRIAQNEMGVATAPSDFVIRRLKSKRAMFVGVGVGLFFLFLAGWLLFYPHKERATYTPGRSVQLTSDPGVEIDPVLSPDGRMIAYSGNFKGALRVVVRQVMGGRTICLTDGMPGYQRFPRWSADGSEITFTSMPSADQYAVLTFGGVPRKLVNGVKSPDGRQFAIVSGDTIYAQSVDGRKSERLTTIHQPHSLSWSPDGLQIVFVSGNIHYVTSPHLANIAPSSIFVVTLSDGVVSQISDSASLNVNPAWSNDGRRVFFVSSRDGARDVYSVAINRSGRPAGAVERLTTGLNAYSISLSADGNALVYAGLNHTSNIWSIPIPSVNAISSKDAIPVTTGNQVIENLAISPDGQWLAYDSNRPGNQDIFKMMVKGGEPIQLTTDPRDDFVPSWSADEKMITFHSFRNGNRDVFVMLDDGTQQQQITHEPAQEFYPDWSPDGNQLVFSSNRTGRLELYIVSKKPGSTEWESPRQVTFDGGAVPRWSPNGMWIGYIGNGISVISPEGGTSRVLVSWEGPARWPERGGFIGWSKDGRTVYYSAGEESRNLSWWAVSVDGGKPRLLVMGDDRTSGSNAGFATDGKTIFFTISNYESDIWKMELLRND